MADYNTGQGNPYEYEKRRKAKMAEAYNPPLEDDWRAVASDAADIIDAKNEEIGTLVDALERIAYHPFAEVRGEMDYEWIAGSMRRLAFNALASTHRTQ